MGQRQAYIILAFLAAACLADVSQPNAIPVNIMAPQKAEAPVTFVVKNQTDVRADKKAMIDFSSEFAENGNGDSDDLLEEDQSEAALEKEEADYDDQEIEDQSLEDDNDVEDLSGGSTIQPSGDELSFEDDESDDQSYDDYDSDEDSAADDDEEEDNTFTEADDEQVMSDISGINDYKDDDGEDDTDTEVNGGDEDGGEEEGGDNSSEEDEAGKESNLIFYFMWLYRDASAPEVKSIILYR